MTTQQDALRKLIADDAYAMSFQSIGQYRKALLEALAAQPEQPVAWRYQTPTGWHATTDAGKAMSVSEHHAVEPLYASPQVRAEQAAVPQWISVEDRLPETTVTDDSECWLQGRRVAAAINSDRVLVAMAGGGVRVDRLAGLEGNPPYWETYKDRVTHWMPLPKWPQESKQS